MHDADILRMTSGIASGQADAIEEFYQRYFDLMFAEAQHCSGRDESFCLDIVQEATVKVVRHLHEMSSEQHLRKWLRVVVRSVAYDFFRQDSRRRKREQRYLKEKDASCTDASDVECTARLIWLEERMQQLDRDARSLLKMKYRLGWTLKRIGNAVGLTTGAVDGRVRRIVLKLQQDAEEVFDDR